METLPIPGYEGWYKVTSDGQVWSEERVVAGRKLKSRLLSQTLSDGYMLVTLCRNGHRTTTAVHRLVALAFLGEKPEGQEVRHLDGNRANNRVENLAYGTRLENRADRTVHGKCPSAAATCKRGHEFTEENTRVYRNQRVCRACARIRMANLRASK